MWLEDDSERSLLSRKLMKGHMTFVEKRNTKIVSKLPNLVPEDEWRERLADVTKATPEELEMS
ncbi:hypothetical protein ACLOJK_006791 [Asimina triloba]